MRRVLSGMHRFPSDPTLPRNPTLIIGALLALGVIRSIERGKAVDKSAEPRVSTPRVPREDEQSE